MAGTPEPADAKVPGGTGRRAGGGGGATSLLRGQHLFTESGMPSGSRWWLQTCSTSFAGGSGELHKFLSFLNCN